MTKVGIVLGSDSDLEVMKATTEVLKELGIEYEATVASAHRSPRRAADYAAQAAPRGLQVIIAAAGMAAHLPGVLAAYTTLPVIGVPVDSSALRGVDALYAIVQMPPGVPVATVGINAARNAGLLAAQIVALGDAEVARRLGVMKQAMAEQVVERAQRVEREL